MSNVYAVIVTEILRNGKAIIATPSKKFSSRLRAGLSDERKKQEQVFKVFGGNNPFEGKRFEYKKHPDDQSITTITLVDEDKFEILLLKNTEQDGKEKIPTDLGTIEEG